MSSSLYDRHWRRRRAEQLRREPLCAMCLQLDGRIVSATVADHVTPHRGDPTLFRGPLQSLCADCHDRRKQQIETSGHMRGCDASGVPLDPAHHWRQPTRIETEGARDAVDAARPLPSPRSPRVGPPGTLARHSETAAASSRGACRSSEPSIVDRPRAFLRKNVKPRKEGP